VQRQGVPPLPPRLALGAPLPFSWALSPLALPPLLLSLGGCLYFQVLSQGRLICLPPSEVGRRGLTVALRCTLAPQGCALGRRAGVPVPWAAAGAGAGLGGSRAGNPPPAPPCPSPQWGSARSSASWPAERGPLPALGNPAPGAPPAPAAPTPGWCTPGAERRAPWGSSSAHRRMRADLSGMTTLGSLWEEGNWRLPPGAPGGSPLPWSGGRGAGRGVCRCAVGPALGAGQVTLVGFEGFILWGVGVGGGHGRGMSL